MASGNATMVLLNRQEHKSRGQKQHRQADALQTLEMLRLHTNRLLFKLERGNELVRNRRGSHVVEDRALIPTISISLDQEQEH